MTSIWFFIYLYLCLNSLLKLWVFLRGSEDHMCCGGLEKVLEKVVEKRMHDLENRLKEHMDTRLDALQKRLELTLHQLALVTSTTNPQ